MGLSETISELSTETAAPLIRQMSAIAHKSAINLGIGQLMFPVDPAVEEVIKNPKPEDFRYGPNEGLVSLREVVGKTYNAKASNVVITIGVQEAVYNACVALKNAGARTALLPRIGFGIYKKISQQLGLQTATYDLTPNFRMDFDSLQQGLSKHPDILFLNSPGNPTGIAFSDAENERIAATLQNTDTYVISDEIYRQLTFNGNIPAPFSQWYDKTVVADGISKTGAAAGFRVGWAFSPNTGLVKLITQQGTLVKSCPPTINQRAALPIVQGETQESLNTYRTTLRENFKIVQSSLEELGISVPESTGGFYSFPKLPLGDTEAFCRACAAKENGVVVIPGKAFGAPEHIRISFANTNIQEGMKRLTSYLREEMHD